MYIRSEPAERYDLPCIGWLMALFLTAMLAEGAVQGQVPPGASRTVANVPASQPVAAAPASEPSEPIKRTPEQVEALIKQAGTTKPDWYDSTELKGLDIVDLTWTDKPPPEKRPLGAHMWGIIGSNPKRYTEGIRLLHYALTVNKNSPLALAKTMNALGSAYYELLEDYPRAAFWMRLAMKSAPGQFDWQTLRLARCYYKMGCPPMATAILSRFPFDSTRHAELIRLWAEMGFAQKALGMVEPKARAGMPDSAYLAAGDICRQQGQFAQAIIWYQKVLATAEGTRDLEYNKKRATRAVEAIKLIEGLDLKHIPDGTYTGSAPSFIEEITVEVVVKQGRIESVKVVQSKDDRPLTAWTQMPARIVAKQGLKGVDVVSGATVTSDGIIHAAGKALATARK